MSKTISMHALDRACRFVETAARPLDRAYLEYALAGPKDQAFARAIRELAKFQTSDGGFAHGLEPDIRGPAPSAIATSVAFQYLRAIEAPASTPIVRAAIEYLVRTIDRDAWVWPAIDERVKEGPHAPWWTPNLERFRGYVFNPSAELLGYLYDYRAFVPADVLVGVTSKVLQAIESIEVIGSVYDLYCCMRLAHTETLPAHIRSVLEELLPASLSAVDPDDAHVDLMRLVPTPLSLGYDIVRTGIGRQAERMVSSQAADGGWHPRWEAWHAEAHREWSGEITSHAIVSLYAHHLVAG